MHQRLSINLFPAVVKSTWLETNFRGERDLDPVITNSLRESQQQTPAHD